MQCLMLLLDFKLRFWILIFLDLQLTRLIFCLTSNWLQTLKHETLDCHILMIDNKSNIYLGCWDARKSTWYLVRKKRMRVLIKKNWMCDGTYRWWIPTVVVHLQYPTYFCTVPAMSRLSSLHFTTVSIVGGEGGFVLLSSVVTWESWSEHSTIRWIMFLAVL